MEPFSELDNIVDEVLNEVAPETAQPAEVDGITKEDLIRKLDSGKDVTKGDIEKMRQFMINDAAR